MDCSCHSLEPSGLLQTMQLRNFPLIVLVLLTLAIVTACHSPPRPDLQRLYALQSDESIQQPPVVVIHGSMGARLSKSATGREIWTGSVFRILFGNYAELKLDIDPATLSPLPSDLLPSGITDQIAGRDYYGRIVRTLDDAGGFTRGEPGVVAHAGEKRYYMFTYDWRQDIVENARHLDAYIEQIRIDFDDPNLRVDIVAHSLGGLITRYYARYGTVDVLDDNEFPVNNHGAERIRRVVLLGTPSLGSIEAIKVIIEGQPVGLRKMPPETVATFPSVYQVLPHPINIWLVNNEGERVQQDLFDLSFWQRFQLSVFDPNVIERIKKQFDTPEEGQRRVELLQQYFAKYIERARRFVWSLTVPADELPIRYIVFGGDCYLTSARVLVEDLSGVSILQFDPKEVSNRVPGVDYETLMMEPGDGIVTRASLLARRTLNPQVPRHEWSNFPIDYVFFLCETHSQMTGNINFEDNLLNAILSADPN